MLKHLEYVGALQREGAGGLGKRDVEKNVRYVGYF
jgi:hypothetical protein